MERLPMVPERKKDILFYSVIFTLIALMLCLLLWLRLTGSQSADSVTAGPTQEKLGENGADILSVTIEGAVLHPGTYYLNEGALVKDVLEMAGGFRSDADTEAIDKQAGLTDGQKIQVNQIDPGTKAKAEGQEGKIDINSAAASELEQLPGIGEVLSARIIEYRDQHGKFIRIEEILNVPGIGEKRYESLKDYIKAE